MDVYRRYAHDPLTGRRVDDADLDTLTCFYSPLEHPEVLKQLQRFFRPWGRVHYGARHSANCNAWRAERIQLSKESLPRFAHRVHVFQAGHGAAFGRYLGYLSLRPYSMQEHSKGFSRVAVAHVVPPRHMLRPRYHIITCVDGPPDGVLPLRCVPYCSPNSDTRNRASCLHAAVQEALLLKMNILNCVPISSQDMLTLLWTATEGKRTFRSLSGKGATLEDARRVIQMEAVRGGAVLERILEGKAYLPEAEGTPREWVEKEAHRCITDYLANGLPVIIETHRPETGHSALIFGMHLLRDPEEQTAAEARQDWPGEVAIEELPGRLVIHDIAQGPFTEVSARELLAQAYLSPDIRRDRQGRYGITFLAICPRNTRMGIYSVRAQAWQRSQGEAVAAGPAGSAARHPRMITRLLQTAQLVRRYGHSPDLDTCRLTRDAYGIAREQEANYWWCVEVRESRPEPGTEPQRYPPRLVYAWLNSDDEQQEPRLILRRVDHEHVSYRDREGRQDDYRYPFGRA